MNCLMNRFRRSFGITRYKVIQRNGLLIEENGIRGKIKTPKRELLSAKGLQHISLVPFLLFYTLKPLIHR